MKPYEKYKDTKIAWVERVPEHWEIAKFKTVLSECKQKNENEDAVLLSVSQYTGVSIKDLEKKIGMFAAESLIGYNIVNKNNLVMNIMLAWNGAMGVSQFEGVVSPSYAVFKLFNNIDPQYLHYLIRTQQMAQYFEAYSTGLIKSRLRLYPFVFKSLFTIIPPLPEQTQIAKYLDWKVSQINKVINNKKKQIELLQEYKATIINNTVTKGIDPDVEMKDSGVQWIGKVPKHWDVHPLRHLLRPISIKNQPYLTLLSVERERGVIVRDIDDKKANHNFIPDDLTGYKVVQKNQFVINKMKAWQGSYGLSNFKGLVSPAYFVFNLNLNDKVFFSKAIRSKIYVPFFIRASDGIRVGQWDLNIDRMKDIPFFIPPINESQRIIYYIDQKCGLIDKAIDKLKKEITLLNEYKPCLVSDVVTGQIDVRDVVVPDFDSVDEAIEEDDEINESL